MQSTTIQPAGLARPRDAHRFSRSLDPQSDAGPVSDWMIAAAWSLLALSIVVRLFRFGLRFPLWGDECLLSMNFLERGFAGLLRPLDYHQVAPVAFLWLEELSTQLFGFNEYALRLGPLLAGIASTCLLFRFARKYLTSEEALYAVGFFGVSSYAVRHSAEVKPYAIDALMTVVLVSAAWPLWQAGASSRRWWLLAPLAAVSILVSYPSIFVVGGIGIALFPLALRGEGWNRKLAYLAFGLAAAAAFAVVLATSAGPQFAAEREVMRAYWEKAFPPVAEPWRLPLWLVDAHTGEMFAYPLGGEFGGSTATFICFALGIFASWKRATRPLATITLGTLALALVAAALQRYPYGGHPRLVQYVAPLICLVAGVGLARLLASFGHPWLAARTRQALPVVFALIALGLAVSYALNPYQDPRDIERRAATRQVWREVASRPGAAVDLQTDLGHDLCPTSADQIGHVMYLCNQAIYKPRLSMSAKSALAATTCERPLYAVTQRQAEHKVDASRLAAWRNELAKSGQQVRGVATMRFERPTPEAYDIYEVTPLDCGPSPATESRR